MDSFYIGEYIVGPVNAIMNFSTWFFLQIRLVDDQG